MCFIKSETINRKDKQMINFAPEETKNHDDIINDEIEQEHKEKIKKVNFETKPLPEEEKRAFSEKMKNKNLKPLTFNFRFSAVKFIDMSEFNKEKYYPHEVKEKEEQYIRKLCSDAIMPIEDTIQTLLKNEDFTVKNYHSSANPYIEPTTRDEFIEEIINDLDL